MNHLILCRCGEVLVKGLDADVKIRATKIILFKDNVAFAVCKSCNTEVPLPLKLDPDMLKSMSADTKRTPLYVNVSTIKKSS